MEYFASLRSALHLILVSKPIVSSRMCKMLSAVSKRRSGRKVSPVITLGDGNDGRSTNRVAPLTDCNEAATKFKTELWRQDNNNNNNNNEYLKDPLQMAFHY